MVHCKRFLSSLTLKFWRGRHRRAITASVLIIVTFYLSCVPWKIPPLPVLLQWRNTNSLSSCSADKNKQNVALSDVGINVYSYEYYLSRTNSTEKHEVHSHEELLHDSECVDISAAWDSTPSKMIKICIYDPTKDGKVSYHLKTEGAWEKENVYEMMTALRRFPGMTLVDLGSNLGTFTLQAALAGAEVIAVDALLPNHFLLHKSLVHNHLTCNVTLLHNAVHARRDVMRISINPANIGGSVVTEILGSRKGKVPKSQKVDSICLNDLVPLVRGKDVFLKMDLEGSEDAVLSCAEDFFIQANVKVLLMEWTNFRHNEEGSGRIKTFLSSHRMVPTWSVEKDREIDVEASHAWPDNVFWMKAG